MGKMYEALQKAEKERTPEPKTEPVKPSVDNAVLDDKLVAFFQSSSIVSEQFRKLRTYLFRPSLENKPKTILVTSSFSGDGKSLIAINLAITIAVELHSHAMLVDCDLRNPTLSRWFGMKESKGLSDYLLGYYDLPDLLIKTGKYWHRIEIKRGLRSSGETCAITRPFYPVSKKQSWSCTSPPMCPRRRTISPNAPWKSISARQ